MLTAKDVGQPVSQGDLVAQSSIIASGKKLGLALAILLDALNPDRIVIRGLAGCLGVMLLEPARKRMLQEALPPALAVSRRRRRLWAKLSAMWRPCVSPWTQALSRSFEQRIECEQMICFREVLWSFCDWPPVLATSPRV